MRRLMYLLAAVLALGVIAAGCGGDDDDSGSSDSTSSSTATLSKADFLVQADAICADGDQKISDAANELGGSDQPSEEELEGFVTDTFIPETQGEVDGIRDLGTPEGDNGELAEVLDGVDEALDQLQDDPSLVSSDNNPLGAVSAKAKAYGFKRCGQGG